MSELLTLTIMEASLEDQAIFLKIFEPILEKGESYDYEPEDKLKIVQEWFCDSKKIFKCSFDGLTVGFYKIRFNNPGHGSHIANCSYIVDSSISGKGIGRKMALHSIEESIKLNFSAIQFNRVVSTNTAAVQLWKKLGFEIVGEILEGFKRPNGDFVSVYIMYKNLKDYKL